jgi:hypothetical protein
MMSRFLEKQSQMSQETDDFEMQEMVDSEARQTP